MADYNAPLQDMRFILKDVFDAPSFWQNNENLTHVDLETVDMILEEMAKFSKNVLLPINQSGDDEGARYQGDGVVTTPKGFKDAYQQYAESGWVGLGGNPDFGGQGFPKNGHHADRRDDVHHQPILCALPEPHRWRNALFKRGSK